MTWVVSPAGTIKDSDAPRATGGAHRRRHRRATELKGAVEAAGDCLERTELSDLSVALESVNEATSKTLPEAIRTANEQTVARINARFSALEQRLADLGQPRQSEADLRAQLDHARTNLSTRKPAQLGLQSAAPAQQPPPSGSQDAPGS